MWVRYLQRSGAPFATERCFVLVVFAVEELRPDQALPRVRLSFGAPEVLHYICVVRPSNLDLVPMLRVDLDVLRPDAMIHDRGRVAEVAHLDLAVRIGRAFPPANKPVTDGTLAFIQEQLHSDQASRRRCPPVGRR